MKWKKKKKYLLSSRTLHLYCDMLNNPPPKDIHDLIPRIYVYVTLHGKMIFTNVIELRILR